MSTDGNLILTESVKYSLYGYVIITFFVIITVMFSDKDKHLIQFYSKTRHLGACCIIKLFPEKKDLWIMQDRVYATFLWHCKSAADQSCPIHQRCAAEFCQHW